MDAIKASGRIYHASCYAEISKDAGAAPPAVSAPISRGSTPDNLAGNGKGKRKAEVSFFFNIRLSAIICGTHAYKLDLAGPHVSFKQDETREMIKVRHFFCDISK